MATEKDTVMVGGVVTEKDAGTDSLGSHPETDQVSAPSSVITPDSFAKLVDELPDNPKLRCFVFFQLYQRAYYTGVRETLSAFDQLLVHCRDDQEYRQHADAIKALVDKVYELAGLPRG